ncbi:MAG: flippase [bacterium]|nr:flippase [bacterium]
MNTDLSHINADDDSSGTAVPSDDVHFSGRTLARNSIYNIVGRILPMAVALVTIPFLIDGLGVERFGVLTLAWLTVGYFGVFDLGIGRATTKFVAEATAQRDTARLSTMIWTPLMMLIGLGVLGGLVAFAITPWLVEDVLNIPIALQQESRGAFFMLAASMPFVLGTSGARGVLEGQHRFGMVNALRVPASSFTFVAPVLVMLISNDLFHIVGVLVAGRAVMFFLHLQVCLSPLSGGRGPRLPEPQMVRQLLSFGGWLTISTLVGSLLGFGYLDRFVISSLLDLSAVTYYSTPFEMVLKILLPVAGFMGVMFPVFSAYAANHKEELRYLHAQAVKFLLTCLSPVVIVLLAFAGPALDLWLGEEFVRESTLLLQLMAVGVLICGLSSVPAGAMQALGRPDLMAKLVLIETPIYACLTVLCTIEWGTVGTAAVWVIWQVVHTTILFRMDYRLLPPKTAGYRSGIARVFIGVVVVAVGGFACSFIADIIVRSLVTLTFAALLMVAHWRLLLDDENRAKVLRLAGLGRFVKADERGRA